jgi:hypothetical protein
VTSRADRDIFDIAEPAYKPGQDFTTRPQRHCSLAAEGEGKYEGELLAVGRKSSFTPRLDLTSLGYILTQEWECPRSRSSNPCFPSSTLAKIWKTAIDSPYRYRLGKEQQ